MHYIDTHAHVFSHDVDFADKARYTPQYTVTVEDYIQQLDDNGFDKGVLIQPSFLGTDNRYMLAAIAAYPERLKGVAVVDKDIDTVALQQLNEQGIIGARLNLFGKPCPDLTEPSWQRFLERIAQLGWQVEIHATPDYLLKLLPALKAYDVDVVIDHFGRFDPKKGVQDADYQQVLALLDPAQHWVKVSAYYRLGDDNGVQNATQALALLRAYGMDQRLIWGSDWPHTQHDIGFAKALATLKTIVNDAALVKQILTVNNAALFHFTDETCYAAH